MSRIFDNTSFGEKKATGDEEEGIFTTFLDNGLVSMTVVCDPDTHLNIATIMAACLDGEGALTVVGRLAEVAAASFLADYRQTVGGGGGGDGDTNIVDIASRRSGSEPGAGGGGACA